MMGGGKVLGGVIDWVVSSSMLKEHSRLSQGKSLSVVSSPSLIFFVAMSWLDSVSRSWAGVVCLASSRVTSGTPVLSARTIGFSWVVVSLLVSPSWTGSWSDLAIVKAVPEFLA